MALDHGYKVIRADGSSEKLIKELYHRDNVAVMLTLRSSDIENIYFILNAKSIYSDAIVFSRINQANLEVQYKSTKVNGTLNTHEVIHKRAFNYLLKYAQKEDKCFAFFGYTHKSIHLCEMLQEAGFDVHIYELDEPMVIQAKEDGFMNVIKIDIHSNYAQMLEHSVLVCAMKDEAFNVYTAITLRSNGFTGEIVALSDSKEDNRKLHLAGANRIFDMYEESASLFVKMIENNSRNL